jgi:hypothetical protein
MHLSGEREREEQTHERERGKIQKIDLKRRGKKGDI